jgi:hypothetical protein
MNVFLRIAGYLLVVVILAVGALQLRSPKPASTPEAREAAPIVVAAQPPAATVTAAMPEPASIPTDSPLRTWTSRDGRTTQAEYVYATASAVTIKRTDGRVFTIPIANLADADATWIAQHPRAIEPAALHKEPAAPARPVISQVQLNAIVAKFPSPPALSGHEVTNDLKQLHSKYLEMVKFIRPQTIPQNLAMIRSKIEDDMKRLTPISQTAPGDWSGKRLSSHSAAAENGVLSAREGLSWLQNALPAHLVAYEALLNNPE